MQNISIEVKTQFQGFHMWLNAPEEVSFLRNLHAHIFVVRVMVEVAHHDRDIEFFLFRKDVDGVIAFALDDDIVKTWSCERWAIHIAKMLTNKAYTIKQVSVYEDDRDGAILCA